MSGVTTLYMGITGRDLATQYHRSLSDAQQRPLVVEGGIWFLAILLFLYVSVRVGLSTFRRRSHPSEKKDEIRQSPKKHQPGTKKSAMPK